MSKNKYVDTLMAAERLILHYGKNEKNKDIQIEIAYVLKDLGDLVEQEIALMQVVKNMTNEDIIKMSTAAETLQNNLSPKPKEPQMPQKMQNEHAKVNNSFEVAPSKNTRKDN